MGFAGLNMAHQTGAPIAQGLGNMAYSNQQAPQNKDAASANWICACGTENSGKFCSNCGSPKPVDNKWMCTCGTENSGKFCSNCGNPKPVDNKWICTCKTENNGKFCTNCGKSATN